MYPLGAVELRNDGAWPDNPGPDGQGGPRITLQRAPWTNEQGGPLITRQDELDPLGALFSRLTTSQRLSLLQDPADQTQELNQAMSWPIFLKVSMRR